MKRTGRLKSQGAKARREAPALAEFRATLARRTWCEAAGLTDVHHTPVCDPLRHRGVHAHHVWPEDRRAGRHDPYRGAWLCVVAHDWVHAHPLEAAGLNLLRPTAPDVR